MGLPSLQAMGVCVSVAGGVFPCCARLLWGGGGLRNWGRELGVCEGVLFFLSQVVCFMH